MNFDENSIYTLMHGDHGDPFAVLGPHAEDGAWIVRALLPGAVSVEIVQGTTILAGLARQGDSDVFAGSVPGPVQYQLRVDWGTHQQTIDDPYRFAPVLGELDLWLLAEGTHYRPYEKLGAHLLEHDGVHGVNFAVWAPNAQRVSVVGNFNHWDGRRHVMRKRGPSGIWEIFLPGVVAGDLYKFEIKTQAGELLRKADPYAFRAELRPDTASVVAALPPVAPISDERRHANGLTSPISIYEVHLGSW
ncbi:MAG: 1,4-alpha-glucan branching enzyme, partial [Pseudomonadota bacterium]|nr:1,4-alpha-glucan branching enzyme [Pseudomonadota bacterium]